MNSLPPIPAETLNGLLWGVALVLFSALMSMILYVWHDFKKTSNARFDKSDKAIAELTKQVMASSPAVLRTRMRSLENRFDVMHQWKNKQLPEQLERLQGNLYGNLDTHKSQCNARLTRIETRLDMEES